MIKSIINIDNKWKIILFVNIDYDRYYIIESALTDILAPISVIDDIVDKDLKKEVLSDNGWILSKDEEYVNYMQKVKYRFIPKIF